MALFFLHHYTDITHSCGRALRFSTFLWTRPPFHVVPVGAPSASTVFCGRALLFSTFLWARPPIPGIPVGAPSYSQHSCGRTPLFSAFLWAKRPHLSTIPVGSPTRNALTRSAQGPANHWAARAATPRNTPDDGIPDYCTPVCAPCFRRLPACRQYNIDGDCSLYCHNTHH